MGAGIPKAISWLVRFNRSYPIGRNEVKRHFRLRVGRKVVTGERCCGASAATMY